MKSPKRTAKRGFTLTELLVVIGILVVLAGLSFFGASKFIERGKKVQALAQFRDFQIGMELYKTDHQVMPAPPSKQGDGWDTIYSDPHGANKYGNEFLVSTLVGDGKLRVYGDEDFDASVANPTGEQYIVFPLTTKKIKHEDGSIGYIKGVGEDGVLYDPWGYPVIVAVNSGKGKNMALSDFNGGRSDKRLHTWGILEYTETKPYEQDCVFASYGKDGLKGDGSAGEKDTAVVPLKGSDDVISW